MLDKAKVREIISSLRMVQLRPSMYCGSHDPKDMQVYLTGFQVACSIFGINIGLASPDYGNALEGRGWDSDSGLSLIDQMRLRGMTDQVIIEEMIAIEIGLLERQSDSNL